MRDCDARQTDQLLPWPAMREALQGILRESWESLTLPPRSHLALPQSGTWLIMPAADQELAIAKLVTVHPHNHDRNLPSVQGDVFVYDARTGRGLIRLDGPRVTAVRTAALSTLAAQALAQDSAGDLLIVGTGVQAAAHLQAAVQLLGTSRVYVVGRTLAQAQKFCEFQQGWTQSRSVSLQAVSQVREVWSEVAWIVTATTSREPLIPEDPPTGLLLAAVGSYRRDYSEIPQSVMARAQGPRGLVVVDTEAATREAGELSGGAVDPQRVMLLRDAFQLPPQPRDLVVFKSVGHAAWDLAAARVAVKQLRLFSLET